jgi:5S rRNA maturation endonuclease (ribonuclease M5)
MEEIDQWVEKLVDLQPWIIVEGPKDKSSLRKLGLENIIYLRGKPLFEVVEWVASLTDECVILTDLDREGKKLYSVLKAELQKHKVKIDDRFRNFLFKETDLRQIEGLYNYVRRSSSDPKHQTL